MSSPSPSGRSPSTNELPSGRAVFDKFDLAPDVLHLNHGSFGAIPKSVSAEQTRWRVHLERDPTHFYTYELPGLMREAAVPVAKRFGGAPGDWVFCENATSAINGILASLDLKEGDEIATTSHAYGAVSKAMQVWASRRGAKVAVAKLPSILEGDDDVVAIVGSVLGPRTKLLVIDHITSATAVVLPIKALINLAHRAGVPVLVDGAHAPGQVVLDVPVLGADWYTGNAHKWLFTPRGCGLLWTSPARQAETLPPILSHGAFDGYTAAFDWIGTRDVTPWLCFGAGSAAHDEFGGAFLMERNRSLAAEAADLLADSLGATVCAPSSMRAAMASLRFGGLAADTDLAARVRRALAEKHRTELPVHAFDGNLWLRISAQIYNEIGDYRRCAETFRAVLADFGLRG